MIPANSRKHRLLVVSVDGVSLQQISLLSKTLSFFRTCRGTFQQVDAGPLTSVQPAWAQVLTGKPWYEVGCPGYARPQGSLNQLHIVQERDLLSAVNLLGSKKGSQRLILANLPLVEPSTNRLWLSDGSLPLPMAVSVDEFSQRKPFIDYTSRPFISADISMGDVRASVQRILEVERRRIECFEILCRESDWNLAILRISAFDSLCHVLGPDAVGAKNLSASSSIDSLWTTLDSLLCKVKEQQPQTNICLLSLFSHVPCVARLSLNKMLQQGNYCKLIAASDSGRERFARRTMAAEILRDAPQSGSDKKVTLVSKSNAFDAALTLAGSPVMGCVYVNSADRFKDGIVRASDEAAVVRDVHDYLFEKLSNLFGARASIQVHPKADHVPGMTVQVTGVAMHDAFDGPVVDYDVRPPSVHAPQGFVWTPVEQQTKAILKPVDVNSTLLSMTGLASAGDGVR
jgi:predicted AlkP superfamily phosphohydrolase/phosphomutase